MLVEQWSPMTLAMISISIMAVPASLTVLSVIISILIGLFIKLSGIDTESALAVKLDRLSGNIFYIAFLSVVFINVMALGLFISAAWAIVNFITGLF